MHSFAARTFVMLLGGFFLLVATACGSGKSGGNGPIDCSLDATICPDGMTCEGGICIAAGDGDTQEDDGFVPECLTSADCDRGYVCEDNFCIPEDDADGDLDTADPDKDTDRVDDADTLDPDFEPENLKEDEEVDTTDSDTQQGKPCLAHSDCNDGLFCNGLERCDATGHCETGTAPCDDAVACTTDACDEEANSCAHTADHTTCDDRNPCNGREYCDTVLGCQAGAALECNDNIACTTDTCDTSVGCVHTPADSACDDSVPCTIDTCDTQVGCKHEASALLCNDQVACTTDTCDLSAGCLFNPQDGPCDDAIACTVDHCNPVGGCEHQPDSGLCTSPQLCNPGTVNANPATGCADPAQCTIDSDCDDGLFCTGVETCFNEKCVPGVPVNCNDQIACTSDSCNEVADACAHAPVDAVCSNGNPCDGNETCIVGAGCQPGLLLNCNDGVSCTMDSCDPTKGCVNSPVDNICNDNLSCTVDRCTLQGCTHTADNTFCNDRVPCTVDTCDPARGCVYTPNDNYCDDGIGCTSESCSTQYNCQYIANASGCNDSIACTDDTCELGVGCKNTPNSDNCAENEVCAPEQEDANAATGCAEAPQCQTDAQCADGNACNGAETCNTTTHRCQPPAAPLNCDDTKACTVDSCDPANGCLHTPNHQYCDDSNDCTADICTSQSPEADGCYHPVTKDSDHDNYMDASCSGGTDCNDANAAINPGATENCTDGIDNDCDGKTDTADSQCSCGSGCASGQACCGGGCVDILLSNQHCGGCNRPCATACWQGTCLPAGKCADALRNVITANMTYSSKNTCGAGNTIRPQAFDGTGEEHIYAIRGIAGRYVEVEMSTTDGSSVDNETLYLMKDCRDTSSGSIFLHENDVNSSYNDLIIGEDGGDEYKNNGGIFFAVADYGSYDCGRYNFKVNYDWEPSSCQQGALLPGKSVGACLFGLGLGLMLMALRRARRRRD